ncbi:ROK family transcriptional regulator [Treponema primitia]|uniref:ROK family transcriptional regulator n=1 Tax=Treponema primitia TaxID=88058 RepID=UPI00025555E1|nr:ROK family transcriptional regulator [Treponema primitia]
MPKHKQEILVGNHGLIKYINKKNVLDTILREEQISRIDISKRVKLAMPTVMRIVDEFVNDGLVIEIGKGSSNGGRKPNLLSVNADARYFLATLISGSVRSVVANMQGKILSDYESEIDFSGQEDHILTQLKNCMQRAIEGCGLTANDIAYSSIGTPGMGFKYYTAGKTSHVFGYWSKLSINFFKKQGQFEYPTAIENIAKMGALGELRYGKGKYYSDYLFIFAGTGVGMGVVRNGSFELGVSGTAGEFGHTIIDYNGPECYCGNRGCIESYCSTIAICREYKRERINNGFDAASDYSVSEVAEAVRRGESYAVTVAKRIGMLLGIGIANAINLYNPDAVIVGGELCEVPLCIEAAFEEAKRHIFRNASRDVNFLISSRDNPILIMGTIAYAMENCFNEYCKC